MSNPNKAKPKAGDKKGAAAEKSDAGQFMSFDELLRDTVGVDPGGGQPKSLDVLQSPFKAREEILAARSRSTVIIEQAEQEAERLKQQGYQDGLEAGRKEVREQTAKLIRQYEATLSEIQAQRVELQKRYEEESMALIKVMVEWLANHEVNTNSGAILNCLRKAMEFVVEKSEVKVRLNPEDFQRVKAAGLQDPALLEGKSQVRLIEDPAISVGGCFLESGFGEIDATMEGCRARLFTVIDEAFRSGVDGNLPNNGAQA